MKYFIALLLIVSAAHADDEIAGYDRGYYGSATPPSINESSEYKHAFVDGQEDAYQENQSYLARREPYMPDPTKDKR